MPHPAALRLIVGFQGTTIDADLAALLKRGVGGVILFSRNVESPRQTAELSHAIRQRAGRPMFISVDQEGGRVQRLRDGYGELPSMRNVRRPIVAGRVLARQCVAAGCNLNFAPVLDVDINPDNPVIGPRAFGLTPAQVIAGAIPVMRELQRRGVASCGKHFPGHGETLLDSHHALPALNLTRDRLERTELPPFAAAIRAGIACIMLGHLMCDVLDPANPASLSASTSHYLRRHLGFRGVTVSDDLEMAAVAELPELILRAADACDLLLMCHRPDRQHAALDVLERVDDDAPINCILQLLERFPPIAAQPEVLETAWHRSDLQTLAD